MLLLSSSLVIISNIIPEVKPILDTPNILI
jgi:hypothetical protein